MRVMDAMHARVGRCAPDTALAEVAALMRRRRTGVVLVCRDGRIVGLLTDRDIVVRGFRDGRDPGRLTAGDVMTEQVVTCRAGDGLAAAHRVMEETRIRRLPVLDGAGRLVGLLSLSGTRGAADGLHAPGGNAHLRGTPAAPRPGVALDGRSETDP
jgi:CBS domain-containing protein